MLEFPAKAIDISIDGKNGAIGCSNGELVLFNPETLALNQGKQIK